MPALAMATEQEKHRKPDRYGSGENKFGRGLLAENSQKHGETL